MSNPFPSCYSRSKNLKQHDKRVKKMKWNKTLNMFVEKRKKHDKTKPKRSLCGYMFFAKLERKNIVEESGISKSDIAGSGRLLGGRWRGMSAEQKVPYELLAEKDKTRYFKQMELWNSKQKKR